MEPDAQAARWQPGSFTEFFEMASPYMVRLGYLLLGERSAAEDVAQDVLEEIYKRWPTLREESVLAYAHTAVVNRARSVGRRRAVASKFSAMLATPEAAPDTELNDPWLWRRVQALPRRQREVVVLRYWCDLPEAEIANVLGVSAGTVKSSASGTSAARPGRSRGGVRVRSRRSPESGGRVMDLLERELRSALDRAATAGVSGQVRLRNPALVEAAGVTDSMAGMKRSGRWLIVASAAMTVTAIAAVVAVGTNRTGHRVGATDGQLATASPAKSSSASPTASPRLAGGPGSDGVHTLWHLAVPPAPTRDVGGLPLGAAPEVPKPYVVLPGTAPDLARYPTLVTADGPVEFKGAAAVFLVGSLPQGVLVATTGLGHDGQDGMRDVHLLVVGKGNVQREIFHGPAMLMASVAPDGATVAVNTWLQDASAGEVDLVDVASATITHRLPGQFTDLGWAANDSLLLIGPGESPKSYAWGTPWSAAGARALGVDLTYVVPSAKGLIGVNQSLGCLERLDASLNVVEASCGGWSAGPLSPDGRYVDVVWQSATDASKRVGVLDTTTDQVVNMSVVDGGGAQWLGQGKVLLTPQAANNGGDRANPSPDSAVCVLASDTCERVPAASFTRLFQAAEWLGK